MVQLAPAARLLPQLLVWKKFKLATMLVMVNAALPLFVSVTGSGRLVVPTGWLPESERVGGIRVTTGATPAPVRVIVRGLPLPLSVEVTVPGLVRRGGGGEGRTDRAASAHREARATVTCLCKIAAGSHAGDVQRSVAAIGQCDRLGRACRTDELIAKN